MTTVSAGTPQTISLPAGQKLTVSADALSTGRVWAFNERLGDTPGATEIIQNGAAYIGPNSTDKRYQIDCDTGSLTYSVAEVDFPTSDEAAEQMINWLPLYAVPISGTYHPGMVEMFGAGEPAQSVRAYAVMNPAGDENTLVFTAVIYGNSGNNISVEYVDPAENDASLSVSVSSGETLAVVVNLATDSEGAITSTAADIVTAIEGSDAASFVTVEIGGGDGGSNDGSGVVTAMGAEELADGSGVGVGAAAKGSRYTDTTTPALYLNTGTDDRPIWARVLTTNDL